MSANIQYQIAYEHIGPIFEKAIPADNRTVQFIKESRESKYSMVVDLADLLDHVLDEDEFDHIAELKSDMKMYEKAKDEDKLENTRDELKTTYNRIQLEHYDEFKGHYGKYSQSLADKVLADMADFSSELSDTSVFVETWL